MKFTPQMECIESVLQPKHKDSRLIPQRVAESVKSQVLNHICVRDLPSYYELVVYSSCKYRFRMILSLNKLGNTEILFIICTVV